MKILLLAIGKTDSPELQSLIANYSKRIGHYLPFELKILPDVRRSGKTSQEQQKEAEGRAVLGELQTGDRLVLFDERGRALTSVDFAHHLEQRMLASDKRMVFVIGGPYGFSPELYARADEQLTLSRMTFSHQMVRLFAVEQIYRAMTILRGEPYHHE